MALRLNQYKAVNESVNNNFLSGVHCHATGTGKSWIALELIIEYDKKNNKSPNLILWLCEQKSILIEQFNIKTLKEKGYDEIFDKFNILNYTEKKPRKWYEEINSVYSSSEKSTLVVINRSFLVSGKKYENIEPYINLIIHDECHSVSNNTTKLFYEYILDRDCEANKKQTSCIGFSATPNLEIKPFDNLISHYSIYDAFCDDVILNSHIKWVKSDSILKDKDIIKLSKLLIKDLVYKKIIIWCGTIELCNKLASLWSEKFEDFLICVDTSENNDEFSSYEDFKNKDENAILFCACKHREGSDIKNLDCCIFLDKVENRNPKTFVQCIGRVLRKDDTGKKKYGLIVDLKASSCLKICDRVNEYLNSTTNFPWKYTFEYTDINKKSVMINHLELTKETKDSSKSNSKLKEQPNYTIEDIKNKFIYECPSGSKYRNRLKRELELINEKKLCGYLLRAVEILEITNYIPHVTRGSCGSSLVCYLLGISNVDPLVHDIKFERFLNDYRDNLPDIDLDFPHFLRDEVFLKLELTWPNQVARISNHVYWHEKSALREAIRKIGINKQIPKEEINIFVKKLGKKKRDLVEKYKNELIDTFRHYSLHCGGIVFFHDGVPDDIKINGDKKTISQIMFDKNDIAKQKNFKIDILSSRGISQLIDICGRDIDFTDCPYDEETYKILQNGDNIGLTLAESPLMRKALLKVQPKTISDIAKCLAIIRPAAKEARMDESDNDSESNAIQSVNNMPSYDIDLETKFVYDDDAISILSEKLNISNDLADKFRRCISKNKWEPEMKEKYENAMSKIDGKERNYIEQTLSNLRKYSFCKSHSYSYAQLVYKLAYQKAHNKKDFWKATLKNTHSAYRKWVHLYEARLAGVNVNNFILKKNDLSIYAKNRLKKFNDLSKEDQLRRYGYWDMTDKDFFPNCYFYEKDDGVFYFGGLIASSRMLSYDDNKKIVLSVGVGPGKYIEILTKAKVFKVDSIGIKGRARLKDAKLKLYQAHVSVFY